jgi:molybdenum cofactor cytidylyltransferase
VRTLEAVRGSKVDEAIVVIGYKAEEIRRKVDVSGFKVVVNESFKKGMSTSIKVGIATLDPRSAAALIVLADQPFLSASLIDGIIEAFQKSHALIVAPTFGGVQRNPVLISRQLFPELSAISGDVGAKSALERHRESLLEYPVEKADLLIDVDTPSDLDTARRILKQTSVETRRTAQSRNRASGKGKPGKK